MNPDELIREIEMDENPWDVEKIKEEILKTKKK